MDWQQILISIISSGALLGFFGFLFGRKKSNAEVEIIKKKSSAEVESLRKQNENLEIDNVNQYHETYNKLFQDMKQQVMESVEANAALRLHHEETVQRYENKLDEYIKEQKGFKRQIRELTNSNKRLHEDIQEMRDKYPCAECPQNN